MATWNLKGSCKKQPITRSPFSSTLSTFTFIHRLPIRLKIIKHDVFILVCYAHAQTLTHQPQNYVFFSVYYYQSKSSKIQGRSGMFPLQRAEKLKMPTHI